MKKIMMISLLLLLPLCGCEKKEETKKEIKENFFVGYTLDDGRFLNMAVNVPYKNTTIGDALFNGEITLDEFTNFLEEVAVLKDGGSKIYRYNHSDIGNQVYGNEDFYVVTCHSLDGITDILIARHKETLDGKCSKKINDLENVSMKIKEGTLTDVSATVVITDTSNRDNVYGSAYVIEEEISGLWKERKTLIDHIAWTAVGYSVDENHTLEFNINWKNLYGKLPKGKYRIVKDTSYSGEGTEHYLTAEFEIE